MYKDIQKVAHFNNLTIFFKKLNNLKTNKT